VVEVGMTGVKSCRLAPWEQRLGMVKTHEE
jgi:hypothetical protein